MIAVNLTGTFNVVRFAALEMSMNPLDPATGERGVIKAFSIAWCCIRTASATPRKGTRMTAR